MANRPPRNASKKLLVVEDDPGLQKQLRWCFSDYDAAFAADPEAAINEVRRLQPAVVTLDLGLPPDPANASAGLAVLSDILELSPDTKVIVVTGNDDRDNAVAAVGNGAYDFYQKPVDPDVLKLIVDRAFQLHELELEHRRVLQGQIGSSPLAGIIAGSPEMLKVCRTVEKVAETNAAVLLLGESGTGKELLARAVHDLSARASGRFVAINCAAIPETLLESELFGYEKGAFTGANKQTLGKIEYAHEGTLFLDEVGDLPTALQAKLLRFLQEKVIERVGGREELAVDVRIVCATHQDLTALIEQNAFREDLYYRISEIKIEIPPLRARTGDAVVLARAILLRQAREHGRAITGFSKDALAAIEAYAWPGNARELENRINRAVIMCESKQVTAEDLELADYAGGAPAATLREVREQAERRAVHEALARSGGKVAAAAEALGISRPTLYDLMNKYGVSVG